MAALKQLLLALAALCTVLGPATTATAREPDSASLRAAFLYNFAQFITWPEEKHGRLSICSHGQDELGPALSALAGRRVRQMSVVVQHSVPLARLGECQVVYLPGSERTALAAVLKATAGRPLLLVVDFEAGAQLGAGVALTPTEDGRLGFQLNLEALREAGLTASSRLITLARRVY